MKNNDFFYKYAFLFWVIFSILFSFYIEWKVFPEESISWSRFGIIIIVLIIGYILSKIIYKTKLEELFIKKSLNINRIFLIISLVFGISFGILIPLHEIPDEITHINMAYEERNVDAKFTEVADGYYGDLNIISDSTTKVDKNKYFDFSKNINVNKPFNIPKVFIIKHLPQWIAMVIGEVLHLPVIIYLALIELFALLFYIVICNIALKKMPFKKMFLMACMLLPVCIQQMASVSYDVVLLPMCFLFIASIFELKYTKKKISLKDLLLLLLYIGIITICKPPYGIMILLILLIPLDKIDINIFKINISGKKIHNWIKGHKLLTTIIAMIITILGLFVVYKVFMNFSYGRVLIGSIYYFKDTARLYRDSLDRFFIYYNDSIFGNLGVFNIETNKVIECLLYLSLFFITFFNFKIEKNKEESEEVKFSIKDYIVIYGTILIMGYLIILSMYPWTLNASGVDNWNDLSMAEIHNYLHFLPYIGGVQGRYFIPLLPLLYLPLGNKKIYDLALKLNPIIYQIAYYLFMYIYFVYFLLNRFWI